MTEGVVQDLANTDDPEAIGQIIQQTLTGDSNTNPSGVTSVPSLNKLYNRYLSRRRNNSPTTIAQYKRTIPGFIDTAEQHGAETPDGLSTELVDLYVDELFSTYDKDATILVHTKNVRAWLNWLNTRDYCPESIVAILNTKELGLSPTARDEAIPTSVANHILKQLSSHRKGSVFHAIFELGWNAGPRLGGLHSPDLKDFNPEKGTLKIRHRPSKGTRLKNGKKSNRDIVLDDSVVTALKLYIATNRNDVQDGQGRQPLFTTGYGRASKSTLRRWIYEITSCQWAPESAEHNCDGSCDTDSAVCPHSYYPHALRRGAIVHHLSGGLAPHFAADRFDVSPEVIEEHYDPRFEERRLQDRIDVVRDAW